MEGGIFLNLQCSLSTEVSDKHDDVRLHTRSNKAMEYNSFLYTTILYLRMHNVIHTLMNYLLMLSCLSSLMSFISFMTSLGMSFFLSK